jgi:hydrogenase/urease accessory protein HupE
LAVLVAILALPRTAQAHLVTSGGGPFFDGWVHFCVSPDDFLTVVALALFSGLAGKRAARGLVLTLPVAWLLGTLIGFYATPFSAFEFRFAGVSLLGTGLLLGINLKLPTRWLLLIAVLVGTWHGFLNGLAMAATGTSGLAAVGIAVAATIAALLMSAAAASLAKPWQLIAVRVVGSWVAAIGLLALAWEFRPGS